MQTCKRSGDSISRAFDARNWRRERDSDQRYRLSATNQLPLLAHIRIRVKPKTDRRSYGLIAIIPSNRVRNCDAQVHFHS